MPNRREFIAMSSSAAVITACSATTLTQSHSAPNIIFILADDLGWADLGCYGRSDIETPNLDRLSEEGMLFTDAYANSSVCSPTRLALFDRSISIPVSRGA